MPQKTELNLHQKLLKIANMAGVLQKNKAGYNYRYVTEDEIQAKITAGMQKYGVMLYPSLVPGTLNVSPYQYQKPKTKKENGKVVEYMSQVNEVIVSSEVQYKWVDADNPEDNVICYWAYIGQMEDASQAFGAGATYGNRYYLLKALQLATTEDDPDEYRSKQKQAEKFEEEQVEKEKQEALAKAVQAVVEKGKELISSGVTKATIQKIVGKHNNGNENPSSIKDLEVCAKVTEEFEQIQKEEKKETQKKKKGEENK